MKIRPATAADLPALRAIEAQAATAAHWSEQQYQRLLTDDPPRLALVTEDSAMRGFLIGKRIGREWELENVVISAEARQRGLGSALLAYFLDIVAQQGGERVFLEVRESNAAARALYAKHGFVETGRRRNYYHHPPEDAVLYRKLLTGAGRSPTA